MNTKMVLESVFLFLIGFYTVDRALASYVKLSVPLVEEPRPITRPVLPFYIDTGPDQYHEPCCSAVTFVTMDKSTRRVRYRILSDQDVGLLMSLSKKIGKNNLNDFITEFVAVDEPAFLRLIENRLQDADMIANN